jgi:hypothetical protein
LHQMLVKPALYRLSLLFCLLGLALGLASCRSKSTDPKAEDAIAALRKVQAATQVGVTYIQYGPLVIDAKAKVNSASEELPEGELRTELIAAMDAYADAWKGWGAMQGSDNIPATNPTIEPIVDKYHLHTRQQSAVSSTRTVLRDEFLNTIWAEGSSHLQAAARLVR